MSTLSSDSQEDVTFTRPTLLALPPTNEKRRKPKTRAKRSNLNSTILALTLLVAIGAIGMQQTFGWNQIKEQTAGIQ